MDKMLNLEGFDNYRSDEELRRWRKLVTKVRDPRRRFRTFANLEKRSEAAKAKRMEMLPVGTSFDLNEHQNLLSEAEQTEAQNPGDTEDIDGEGNSNDHSINISDTEGIGREGNSEDVGREGGSSQKVWIFLIANLVVELLSAVFDQLSSKHKPKYALVAMLMAFVGLLGCIAELAFKGVKESVSWRWDREIPWFYSSTTPSSYRRFGTFAEIFGLVCAILQSILSMIAYVFYSHHADNPIKGSFVSVVFAFGLLSSQFLKDQSRKVAGPDHGDWSI
ncbi:hypothetical protein REPUB_Repub04eG0025200 [Reevesia pubescens]